MCFFSVQEARTLSKIVATQNLHRLRHWSRNGVRYRNEKEVVGIIRRSLYSSKIFRDLTKFPIRSKYSLLV
jgi:hypothetical protein